jgi:hypothetical protein
MGDHVNDTRVTSAHLTCAQIAQPGNHGSCYSSYTVRECCKTCVDIRSPIKGTSIVVSVISDHPITFFKNNKFVWIFTPIQTYFLLLILRRSG